MFYGLLLLVLASSASNGDSTSVWVTFAGVVIVGLLNLWGTRRVHKRVDAVVTEVKTSNGNTLAELADRVEGRRVIADVPVGERTTSERHAAEIIEPNPNDERPRR